MGLQLGMDLLVGKSAAVDGHSKGKAGDKIAEVMQAAIGKGACQNLAHVSVDIVNFGFIQLEQHQAEIDCRGNRRSLNFSEDCSEGCSVEPLQDAFWRRLPRNIVVLRSY